MKSRQCPAAARLATSLLVLGALALTRPLPAEPVGGAPAPWRQASTEHFTFVYRADQEPAVAELLSFAEEVYDEVTGLFDSRPPHVPVVVYGVTDIANGYYTPAPPQHIGLYVVNPSLQFIGAKSESWLRVLLVHELTHYVQANYERGVFNVLGRVFGRSVAGLSLAIPSLWTIEGLAVNAETMFSNGGRGSDPFFEMKYKAPVLEDRFFAFSQAAYDSHLAPRGRYYVAGYLIWEHLLRHYGSEALVEIMDRYSRFPLFGMRGPIRRTTGRPVRTLYADLAAELAGKYAGLQAPGAGTAPAERVSPSVRADYYLPTETAVGFYLYRTRPDRPPAIVRFDPRSGAEEEVLRIRLTDHASWTVTADGATIYFATVTADATHPDELLLHSDIYRYEPGGPAPSAVTAGGGYFHPAVAADGTFLVAVERAAIYSRLVRIDTAEGSGRPQVLVEAPRTTFYAPALSPSGRLLATVANREGTQMLLLVDTATGEHRVLAQPEGGMPYFPTFDGEQAILYANDRGGALALYRHDLDLDTVTLAATDPVGVYAGIRAGPELILASYTSDGHTLRRAEAPPRAGPARAEPIPTAAGDGLEAPPPTPPVGAVDHPAIVSIPYRAVPTPDIWLPVAGIAGPPAELASYGVGAMVAGADLLMRNRWTAGLLWFPALGQLDHSAAWSTELGRWAFVARAESAYAAVHGPADSLPVAYAQLFRQGVTVGYTLLAEQRLGVTRVAAIQTGATSVAEFRSEAPFTMADVARSAVPALPHYISAGARAILSRTPIAAERAYYVPWAARAGLSLTTPLVAPDYRPSAVLASLDARLNLPIAADHVVSIAPVVRASNDPSLVPPAGLRGFGEAVSPITDANLRYGVAVEYHTPLSLFDVPLGGGVGLTGVKLSAFLDTTGSVGAQGPVPDPAIAVGGLITPVIHAWTRIPLDVGVAVRLQPGIRPFDPRQDLRLILGSDLALPRLFPARLPAGGPSTAWRGAAPGWPQR